MIETDHTVTPSPVNPLGVKGVGEAGTIGVDAASSTPWSTRWRRSGSPISTCRSVRRAVWAAIQEAEGGQ